MTKHTARQGAAPRASQGTFLCCEMLMPQCLAYVRMLSWDTTVAVLLMSHPYTRRLGLTRLTGVTEHDEATLLGVAV
jgi:hypothetical protein